MTVPITAADLTWMRAADADTMPDTCTITTMTPTDNGAGESPLIAGATITVACRAVPLNGDEPVVAAKLAEVGDWAVTVPYGTTVTPLDRVTVSGHTLEVKFIYGASSWPAAVRVIASQVE